MDDDVDLQDAMRDVAAIVGIERVVTVGSLAMLEAQRAEALSCSLAILDINLGDNAPSGIEVYRWLARARYAGTVAFLTGHGADDARVQEAARIAGVPLLTKPIGIADLATLVSRSRAVR